MIPRGSGGGRADPGLKGVTIVDCANCGRPTVFIREPRGQAFCAGCAGTPSPERETPRTCPIDGQPLSAESRANVTIDRCPECCGVWLDSGELDTILGAASAAAKQNERVAALLMDMFAGSSKRGRGQR